MEAGSYRQYGRKDTWDDDTRVAFDSEPQWAPEQDGWRKRRYEDDGLGSSSSKRARHSNGYDTRHEHPVETRLDHAEHQNGSNSASFHSGDQHANRRTSNHRPIPKLSIDSPPRLPEPIRASSSRKQDTIFFNNGPLHARQLATRLPLDVSIHAPSAAYESITRHPSEAYEPSSLLPLVSSEVEDFASAEDALPLRQLIVLDLNGSLLYRHSAHMGKRAMWRRPYLDCFVQYLSHERTTNGLLIERTGSNKGKRYFHLLPTSIPNVSSQPESRVDRRKQKKLNKKQRKQQQQQATASKPSVERVNTERLENLRSLRKQLKSHPKRFTLLAPLDAMIWSSVQPHNLPPMVDTAFGWRQDCLRACWSRSMLGLSAEGFHRRVQTTKNLDRIWFSAEGRYGAASTLLMDDTALKARLQPWNLLQINEYVAKRRGPTSTRDRSNSPVEISARTENGESTVPVDVPVDPEEEAPPSIPLMDEAKDPSEEEEDKTLLAVIGVLEELRSQRNVAAWMREGGLWAFLQEDTPLPPAGDVQAPSPDAQTNDTTQDQFVAGPEIEDEHQVASLRLWCMDPDALAHWTAKGIKALQSRGISVKPGIIVAAQDEQLVELCKVREMYA
ncbi:SubName: Full=Uncharacterized protein {ECO:0000313/EMBL:CCA69431.1} [Serendipita indica DSM 11827]|nr:SubName: Full=Uncharacterized protein {ECO:0000313/EMBL:CCA69431.1} [Serendipita indica DSM 11827]